MIDWAETRAMLEERTAAIFDITPCRLQPRMAGLSANHARSDDIHRPAFDFRGTLDLQPPADTVSRHPPADPGVRTATVAYAAVLTANVGGWPYRPKKGDHVLAAGERWQIEASEEDGSTRPAWYLSKVTHAGG